ncbi:sulfurtransferase complex subunit TusB [Halopseudomonas phragmitis]|uniref:Sulfurtransferase complex subunit TusB n=2 Tax=Pseudomonadaceae TaxID=135621 RepID=A0A1V0BA72_9GAMM|nr:MULTISPECIES: sulfurtransferase complex subunit TusB [Pseudomonadaceae]AQZ96829.1 hypothetical protein BVH74_13560 [Halopseudomonas phragmitis]PAU87456.1 sulfurtransferase complex subunit TusB [Pseudomonas sp. WN033]RHW22672.1 sulfurtransferase complex subunit TusB [Pseudomonas jilinensis]
MLHIVRHSPHNEPRLSSCLQVLVEDQGLLLIEDAVYALLPGSEARQQLSQLAPGIQLFALEPDLLARGLALDDLPAGVSSIDYQRMVDLCVSYDKVVSW